VPELNRDLVKRPVPVPGHPQEIFRWEFSECEMGVRRHNHIINLLDSTMRYSVVVTNYKRFY